MATRDVHRGLGINSDVKPSLSPIPFVLTSDIFPIDLEERVQALMARFKSSKDLKSVAQKKHGEGELAPLIAEEKKVIAKEKKVIAKEKKPKFVRKIISIDELKKTLDLLNLVYDLTEDELLTVEEYRTALMRAVQASLQIKTKLHDIKPKKSWKLKRIMDLFHVVKKKKKKQKKASIFKWTLKWTLFMVVMLFEFGPVFCGNLLYASMTLSALTPYINLLFQVSPIVMKWLGVGCVLNSMLGSISFIAPILMERMGIPWVNVKKGLTKALQLQLEITKNINHQLNVHNELTSGEFKEYSQLARLFNNRADNLKKKFLEQSEPWYSILASIIMGTLMIINAACGALYMSVNFFSNYYGLTLYDPVAITNFISSMLLPVGLLAIPIMAPHLIISFYIKFNSASKIFNPNAEEYDKIKNEFEKLELIGDDRFDMIHTSKQKQEKLIIECLSKESAINSEVLCSPTDDKEQKGIHKEVATNSTVVCTSTEDKEYKGFHSSEAATRNRRYSF